MNTSLSMFAGIEGVSAFKSFLPSLAEVRRGDSETKIDVRIGEIAACAITLTVGVLISTLENTATPVAIAVAICVVMVAIYETVLRMES